MWCSEKNKKPRPGESVSILLKNGRIIQAKCKLYGTEIMFERDGEIIKDNSISCWNLIEKSTAERKKCRACGERL